MRARAGRLHSLHRGVYAVGHTALTLRGRWMAAVLALGPGAVLSHRDAAALWGLRDPEGARIDVTVPRAGRGARRGINVHRSATLHRDDRARSGPIPLTAVPRTLLDLAEILPARQLRRAYEEAERLRVLDLRAIERLLERSNGRRGTGRLRALLDYDSSPAAETAQSSSGCFST
jgi:predicted transcriptional regulator of viral defense system